MVMNNGLIRRAIRLGPNAATVAFDNLMADQPLVRAARPEAILTLNGFDFAVGGLTGQPDHGYLRREWIDSMTNDPNAFQTPVIGRRPVTLEECEEATLELGSGDQVENRYELPARRSK